MKKKHGFGELTERDGNMVSGTLSQAMDKAFITVFPHFVIFYDMPTSVELVEISEATNRKTGERYFYDVNRYYYPHLEQAIKHAFYLLTSRNSKDTKTKNDLQEILNVYLNAKNEILNAIKNISPMI